MDKTKEWQAIGLLDYIRDHCENNDGLYDKTHLINKISKAMQQCTTEVSREKQEALNKIGELLEKDIPEQKFILALLQIKKWVMPFYKDSTGI